MPSGPLMYSCFTGPPKPSENEHTVKIISTRSVILLQIVMVSHITGPPKSSKKRTHSQIYFYMVGDFVTNSYGESWNSSFEKL